MKVQKNGDNTAIIQVSDASLPLNPEVCLLIYSWLDAEKNCHSAIKANFVDLITKQYSDLDGIITPLKAPATASDGRLFDEVNRCSERQ